MNPKINLKILLKTITIVVLLTTINYKTRAQNIGFKTDTTIIDSLTNSDERVYIVSNINITGNKKTKEKIILRELEFQSGDSITESGLNDVLEKSRKNTLKTSLFNYVTINWESTGIDNYINININVEERWYLWPQADITPHNGNINDWLRNPDIKKIDYCFGIQKYNFRGMKESIYFAIKRGFNNLSQIGYSDIAIEKSRKNLLSFNISISKRKSCVLEIIDNKAEYAEFESIKTAYKEYKYDITYTYRPKINTENIFSINYTDTHICDSIAILNPEYLGNGRTNIKAINLKYIYLVDNRSSSYYPLKGNYLKVTLGKLGVFSHDINTFFIKTDARIYTEVLPRFYFSAQGYVSTSSSTTPFYYRETFGTKPNVMAGYEERQIAGNTLTYIRTSYKFEIIKPHILYLRKLNLPKFNKIHYALYLHTFANCGYATAEKSDYENKNLMNDTFLGAWGAGLDLVTYYDRIFSVYYTRNLQGDSYIGIGIKSFF
ncbi:MAG: hypothetical protein IKQ46_15090 [Bacteroidales bacterium]|nr:hypothetical protein [Bacteroidales bacterium]